MNRRSSFGLRGLSARLHVAQTVPRRLTVVIFTQIVEPRALTVTTWGEAILKGGVWLDLTHSPTRSLIPTLTLALTLIPNPNP